MHVVLLIITCQQHLVCFSVLACCSADTVQDSINKLQVLLENELCQI